MTWKNNIGLKNKIKKKGNKKEKMFNSNKVVLLQQRFKAFVAGQKSETIKKCLQWHSVCVPGYCIEWRTTCCADIM